MKRLLVSAGAMAATILAANGCGSYMTPVPSPTTMVDYANEIIFVSRDNLYTIQADGSNELLVLDGKESDLCLLRWPSWSPDGLRISFSAQVLDADGLCDWDSGAEIFVVNRDGSELQRLTTNSYEDIHPDWSPDGTRILFVSSRSGEFLEFGFFTMAVDGSFQTQIHCCGQDATWSPDGQGIAYEYRGDLYTVGPDEPPRLIVPASLWDDIPYWVDEYPFLESPAWSPNGKRIAFSRYWLDSEGWGHEAREVYIFDLSSGDVRALWAVAEEEARGAHRWGAVWSPEGSRLLYMRNYRPWIISLDDGYQFELTGRPSNPGDADWVRTE